nr:hypothetical protein [Tanacetum cinerariifolium]
MDVQTPTSVALLLVSAPTLTPSTIATFAGAVSSIPGNVQRYMDQRMNEAVKVAVQIQSDRLHDEAQAENDEFLKTIDENMQKIIKEQIKEQFMVQVSKILPKIEQTMNEQLKAEVLTRSSNSSKTSYAIAADISEMELKKILIEKMEGNKYIHQSNEKRNLYKALVEAYESDKIILDTYRDTVTLKRRRDDDADKDEEPFTRSDRGSKRRREGKEPESASAPKEKATRSASKLTQGSKSRQMSVSESATTEEPMQTTHEMEEPSHPEFETGADDQPIVEPSQHPEWFSQQKKPSTPDRASSRKYTTSVTKTKAVDYGHIKWIEDLVPQKMWIQEPRRIVAVTELKIVEWHNYKHLDWIMVRRDDDKLYKFKEGYFKRLRIQYIEDMLLLLVQGKLTNLTVEECFAFNVSLRMFKKMHRNPKACGRPSTRCQKLPEEVQPNKARYVSDGTLTDVRTALDNRLKGIRMKYLPQSIWRKSDKDREAAMI